MNKKEKELFEEVLDELDTLKKKVKDIVNGKYKPKPKPKPAKPRKKEVIHKVVEGIYDKEDEKHRLPNAYELDLEKIFEEAEEIEKAKKDKYPRPYERVINRHGAWI